MLLFASQASGLAVPQGRAPVIETAKSPILADEHWMAYTSWGNQHIYLAGGWIHDPVGQCTLAHELTHWLQMQHGAEPADAAAMETQAYTVGAACFTSQHDEPHAKWSTGRAAFCANHKNC